MGIFKRAHMRGIAHELTRQGLVQWPTKLAEEEAADALADAMPEEEMPEISGEEGLTPEEAQDAVQKLVEVAEVIAEKTGGVFDQGVNKTAAAESYPDSAAAAALSLMHKAAEETAVATGSEMPGTTPPTPDLGATAEAEVDAKKVPSAELVGPQGTSDVDTKPGAVGKEVPQEQPGAQADSPNSEVTKLSEMLLKMSTPGMDGASLSGGATKGPAPPARVDLDDNLNIPGAVAAGQGKTVQKIPETATVGETKKQPAGTPGPTAPTPNEPAKDAVKQAMETLKATEQGRELIRKIAEEAANQQTEEEKTANIQTALQNLAAAIQ